MFIDVSGAAPREQDKWPSIVIPKEAIDLEIARLIDAPAGQRRRASLIVHSNARAPGLGLAPGTDVTINVVNPGERTWNLRKNSNMLEICISGEGVATVAGRDIRAGRWDVWNTPAMQVHSYRNEGKEPWVRLSYQRAAAGKAGDPLRRGIRGRRAAGRRQHQAGAGPRSGRARSRDLSCASRSRRKAPG